ncbi:MAG: aminotransferase DegT [Desulfobacteraceae bacterium]|nr:MAG: aminotransferase DegT [Desulfobacteraceae bacterium]
MRIGRTLPPAAAPLTLKTILCGLRGLMDGQAAVERFSSSLRKHFQMRYCFLVSSGAAALAIILKAARQLQPHRNLVLIPAYTCHSVPASIKRAGLDICPCDIDPATLDFDRQKLAGTILKYRERLLAVVPTHLFGLPADVEGIKKIIAQDNILVVEDAAQAMGSKGARGYLGCLGDVGFFSLGRGKAFSAMGGGVIITNDKKLAAEIAGQVDRCAEPSLFKILRSVAVTLFVFCFSRPALFWLPKSMPFLRLGETIYDTAFEMDQLSPFQAGLAAGWEDRLDHAQSERQANACFWMRAMHSLGSVNGIKFPTCMPNLIRYPLYLEKNKVREALLNKSNRQGLGIMGAYPGAVTQIAQLQKELAGFDSVKAQQVARALVTLPTHSWMTAMDRHRIAAALSEAAAHTG